MSDDEFDQFPDPFAEIDWNTIPGLSAIPIASQPSLSNSDGVPAQVELGPRASTPLMNGSDPTPESSQYSFDNWDAAFLTEISQAEQRLLQPQPAGGLLSRTDRVAGGSTRSTSGSTRASRYFHATESPAEQGISSPHSTHFHPSAKGHHEGVNSTNLHAGDSRDRPLPTSEPDINSTKAVHQLSSPPTREPSPKRHKGKQKESPRGLLKEFLNNFEDEMICPICCDIFAFAHLGNPCGHTFCGDCGWRWIKKNREAPSCAICRANLSLDVPMIPNFSVDSAVEKHVEALCTNGIEGWETAGKKFTEWQARKARWKATKVKIGKSKTTTFSVIVAPYVPRGNSPDGLDYTEEEAGSSSDGSSSSGSSGSGSGVGVVAVRRESTNRRRQPNRRSGGQRRTRISAVERHAGRGGSGPRVRRSRRRRRY